jgi:hypothetical protein
LKHLQVDLEQMTWDYTKMEESSMQQQSVITNLKQTCQDLKEKQVATHMEFEREKQSLTVQIQD